MAGKSRAWESRLPWVIVFAICVGLVAWGVVNWFFVREGPRSWDYGALPDVPGQSVYSSEGLPRNKAVSIQVHRLPEAVPNGPDNGTKPPEEDSP